MKIKVVKITGLNINKLLNELNKNGFNISEVKRLSYDELHFKISSKEYKKLIDLPLSKCYNISVIEVLPQNKWLNLLVLRCGVLLGILVASFFVYSFSTKIWKINVTMDKEIAGVTNEMVISTLKNCGVEQGYEFNTTTREIERKLTSAIDGCSMAVVERDGINLNVFLKAREYKKELSEANVVAEYSGVITDINLVSGILTVNIGEGVTKGQVLIASGTTGDYFSEAVGDIKAKIIISGQAVGGLETVSVKRSGKTHELSYIEVFGKRYECGKQNKIEYAKYETEEQEIVVFKNLLLPIKKVNVTVFELVETKQTITKEELIEKLKQQSYNDAKNSLPPFASEGKTSFDVYEENGLFKVVCNIEVETIISKRQ